MLRRRNLARQTQKWRNWQTRTVQVRVVEIPCGFDSHLLHGRESLVDTQEGRIYKVFFTLKQYFPGSQKSADSPLQIFKAFYLAQSKGLCGNYRHFPAKRF